MKTCLERGVEWAIFSDEYSIWFPHEKHRWYDKSPNDVTDEEFAKLLREFDEKLSTYDEIWFYCNYRSPRFHSLYKRLVGQSSLRERITLFSHWWQIGWEKRS